MGHNGQADQVRELLQFLLQYIPSRTHLRRLTLHHAVWPDEEELLDLFHQFVMAAAQSETLLHLKCHDIREFPIRSLVEFGRANRNVEVLEFFGNNVSFTSDEADDTWDPFPLQNALDKLSLSNRITFLTPQAALLFADLFRHLNITSLRLGNVKCNLAGSEPILMRMFSNLMKSPIKRLEVPWECTFETFQTALRSSTDDLKELSLQLGRQHAPGTKFSLLSNTIQEMAQVETLHITFFAYVSIEKETKKQFFRAIDACATLTEIQVEVRNMRSSNTTFSPKQMQLLQDGRTERNRNLRRFVANPRQLSEKELLVLMLQLKPCASGRYELVRKLPSEGLFPGTNL